jgi:hypothetical protein
LKADSSQIDTTTDIVSLHAKSELRVGRAIKTPPWIVSVYLRSVCVLRESQPVREPDIPFVNAASSNLKSFSPAINNIPKRDDPTKHPHPILFNGTISGISHVHLDRRTSSARTVCCRLQGVSCRTGRAPALADSSSSHQRIFGSMQSVVIPALVTGAGQWIKGCEKRRTIDLAMA